MSEERCAKRSGRTNGGFKEGARKGIKVEYLRFVIMSRKEGMDER